MTEDKSRIAWFVFIFVFIWTNIHLFVHANLVQDNFFRVPLVKLNELVHKMKAKCELDHKCTLVHKKPTPDSRGAVEIAGLPGQVDAAKADIFHLIAAMSPSNTKQYPATWGAGPHNYELKNVEVNPGTPEHRDVLRELRKTIPSAQLIKLVRIQRPKLFVDPPSYSLPSLDLRRHITQPNAYI